MKNLTPINQIKIEKNMAVNELIKSMHSSGVLGAGRLAKSIEIYEKMLLDKDCRIFLGLAGPMISGGMRQIIFDMLEDKWIDVFVTTGANLTHDLIESLGYRHYQGSPYTDDKKLHQQNIDRIYDAFMPNKVYIGLENFFKKTLPKLPKREFTTREFLFELGKFTPKNSILGMCHKNNTPVFCPAIADSGIGLQLWNHIQKYKLNISAINDLNEIIDLAWTAKRAGVIYIGGGVPKNYIQQALQVSKGASYGIQITTDVPEFGGSSGAELREGISWGKMQAQGKFVNLICDATIALPLLYASLKDRIPKRGK